MVLWNGTVAALVADVSMNSATPKVHRAVFAVDCGTVINPDIVVQQSQGSKLRFVDGDDRPNHDRQRACPTK